MGNRESGIEKAVAHRFSADSLFSTHYSGQFGGGRWMTPGILPSAPPGPALRAVQTRSCEFVEPIFHLVVQIHLHETSRTPRLGGGRWMTPGILPSAPPGPALRAVQTRSCEFVEPIFHLVVQIHLHETSRTPRLGGGRWIRTTEGVSQQIYSLPPLAAWVSLRISCLLRSCILITCCPGGGLRRAFLPSALRAAPLARRVQVRSRRT